MKLQGHDNVTRTFSVRSYIGDGISGQIYIATDITDGAELGDGLTKYALKVFTSKKACNRIECAIEPNSNRQAPGSLMAAIFLNLSVQRRSGADATQAAECVRPAASTHHRHQILLCPPTTPHKRRLRLHYARTGEEWCEDLFFQR